MCQSPAQLQTETQPEGDCEIAPGQDSTDECAEPRQEVAMESTVEPTFERAEPQKEPCAEPLN